MYHWPGNTLPPHAQWVTAARKPYEELYDTEQDPHEINKLANDPDPAPILARLRAALDTHMDAAQDLGMLPEAELDRLGNQYGYRHHIYRGHEAAHPGFWHELHAMALHAAQADKSKPSALPEGASSEHAAIRWWAITGPGCLIMSHAPAREAVEHALSDKASLVAVAAAQALVRADGRSHFAP